MNDEALRRTMKPLSVRWMTKAYDYVRSKLEIVCAGFAKAGIAEQYDEEFEVEDIDLDPFDEDSYSFDEDSYSSNDDDDDDVLTL